MVQVKNIPLVEAVEHKKRKDAQVKSTYQGSLNMATVFENKLKEAQEAMTKLIAAETDIAAQIEDTQRQILAMRRVIATLRPIMGEPSLSSQVSEPSMPPADVPNFLTAARNVSRQEIAERNFLTPEEAELAMEQAERMHDEALSREQE